MVAAIAHASECAGAGGMLACNFTPLYSVALHAVALWVWHLPALFQATLDSDVIHTLQHASFLGTALLFWWAVTNGRHRLTGYGMAVLYMFTTALHSGLLGA